VIPLQRVITALGRRFAETIGEPGTLSPELLFSTARLAFFSNFIHLPLLCSQILSGVLAIAVLVGHFFG
jgi:hypothetical protein